MTHTKKNKPTPGTEILLQAHKIVNNDRQNTYGHPTDDYIKVTNIYQTLTGIQLTLNQAILFMVAIKLARLRTNLDQGTLHHDTLLDTIGYLTCLNIINQPQERTTNDNKTKTNPQPTNHTTRKRNTTTPKRNQTTKHTPDR